MKDSQAPTGNIVASLVFFGVTAAIAIILFIDAFVMWLASLTGSVAVAALITGGFFAVLAAVVYLLSVRSAVKYVRDRIDTVYEVASRVKEGYDWLSDKFSFLSFLRKSR
ncbi:hypothetical protein [Alistipes timonensis]|jgi:hypothetical protein|uniref:Holin-X, holin superfamily III n=1 Tax=Alistipes timonensis JC136 TaxID=1033731 RepID=A0A1H4CYE6_9BACT|nr:hypothetical protein [Alistipes timonensis]MCR2031026.1 hypothetical protein [Alistipes timonensis]SEA65411.1 hypothetical protein SAMN05444145_10572 [Alistipes timonensis JC136]